MERNKVKHMFPAANSGDGFYSYFNYMIGKNPKKVYVIKGGPGSGKSSFMKKISDEMVNLGFHVENHHCSFDTDSLDGLVIPKLKTIFLDGTGVHAIEPMYPGVVGEILNFTSYWDAQIILKNKDNIVETKDSISSLIKRAYKYFNGAKVINEATEEVFERYLKRREFYKSVDEYIDKLNLKNTGKLSIQRHFFARALSSNGVVDFHSNLLENLKIIYIESDFLKGSSDFIKEIGNEAMRKGFDLEYYHNPLNPFFIDTLIINNLKIAITSSSKVKDNCYEKILMKELLDENKVKSHYDQIKEDNIQMNNLMEIGMNTLKEAKDLHMTLESYYVDGMDFHKLTKLRESIINKLKRP